MKLYMEKHYKVLSLGKICVNLQCLLLGEKKCLLFQARFDSSPLCYRCCQLSLHLQQSLSGMGQAGYGGAVVQSFLSWPTKAHWPCSVDGWLRCVPCQNQMWPSFWPNWEEPRKLRQNTGLQPWSAHWWTHRLTKLRHFIQPWCQVPEAWFESSGVLLSAHSISKQFHKWEL